MSELKISFEYFPPKTEKGFATLMETASRLDVLMPNFASVTYGACGADKEPTFNAIRALWAKSSTPIASHLTCVGASTWEVDGVARRLWADGITSIVALRGDPPKGGAANNVQARSGYGHASDLVAGLCRIADFDISVAAFPEGHPETTDPTADIENLKRKQDAGANRALTQFFFDADAFLRYRDQATEAGVTIDIVPGILPIQNIHTLLKFSAGCGAHVPSWVVDAFRDYDEDPDGRHAVAVHIAAQQIETLRGSGVSEFHFYTLNRADLTLDVCAACDIGPNQRAAA